MQSTPVSKDLLGIKGSCFDIKLEYNEDFVILHLPYISKMTKEVFIEMKSMLKDWWDFFKTSGYKAIFAAVDPTNQKINRLLTMLKFEYTCSSEGLSVYQFKE
tara:strand:- start:756 stop:1064 length:309 start_codon:yes stop_codon:yes gene_type:complete